MEEKQIEVKQEIAPAEESKIPILLLVIIMLQFFMLVLISIAIVFFPILSILTQTTNYKASFPLIFLLGIIPLIIIGFIVLIYFLKGYAWARIVYIIIFSLPIANNFVMNIFKFSITNFVAFIIPLLIFFYVLFNKDVKAYCSK